MVNKPTSNTGPSTSIKEHWGGVRAWQEGRGQVKCGGDRGEGRLDGFQCARHIQSRRWHRRLRVRVRVGFEQR